MIRCEKCEDRFSLFREGELDIVCTDPPFNASRMANGEKEIGGFKDHVPFKREFGKWDFNFNPAHLIENAARAEKPGAWLIVKSGDVLLVSTGSLWKKTGRPLSILQSGCEIAM
jgi:hypothetical protein